MAKKYYWLKLKDNFFNQKEIKKIRKIAGGDTYTIIYLKMQLLSIKDSGIITFEGTESDLAEQLALEIDEDIDNIKITLSFLKANNLIEEIEEDRFLLPKAAECIGKEGASAERVRRHRERKALEEQKMLQCNADVTMCNDLVTNCNTEIEKRERDREKKKEIEYIDLTFIDSVIDAVRLTQKQYDNLVEDYGVNEVHKKIISLDYYITEKNKTYKDHNKTIRNWFNKEGIEKGKYKEVKTEQRYVRRNSAIPNFDD